MQPLPLFQSFTFKKVEHGALGLLPLPSLSQSQNKEIKLGIVKRKTLNIHSKLVTLNQQLLHLHLATFCQLNCDNRQSRSYQCQGQAEVTEAESDAENLYRVFGVEEQAIADIEVISEQSGYQGPRKSRA